MVPMADEKKQFTMKELSLHNSRSDLWISIQGKVYDVTGWLKDHPGGDIPLLHLAGQDVTDAFIAYHAGSAWAYLDRFFIGHLSDYQVSEISRDYRRMVADFSKAGLFKKKGYVALSSLTYLSVCFLAAVWRVLRSESSLTRVLSGGVIGFIWAQIAFLGHDIGHYSFVKSPGLNRIVQIIIANCITGVSIGWWKWTHNAHHVSCNSLDFDPDLQLMPVFAVSSKQFESLYSYFYDRKLDFDAMGRFLVSYQHLTFYPVMFLARFNLFLQSLFFLSRKNAPNRKRELAGTAVFWIWYSFLVSQLPNWRERAMFVLASFAVSGFQHIQICMSHFSSSVYVGPPTAKDWVEKQTMGTLNISCSPWMDWLHGGLQFQVEHHLFPRLPRCHLRNVSPLVKELCKKHRLTYSTLSFWDANVRTIRTLRVAALQARNLVWEVVNIHG